MNNEKTAFSEKYLSFGAFYDMITRAKPRGEDVQQFYLCAWLPVLIRLIAVHIIDIGFYLEECANPEINGDSGYLFNVSFSVHDKVGLVRFVSCA